jgi:hypothetical protein
MFDINGKILESNRMPTTLAKIKRMRLALNYQDAG